MQTIQLDLSKKEITPILYAKQADVGRKFKAILTDGGVAYPVPAGAAVSIWYSGSSGEGNYTDVGAESAVSVSGNEIVVEMIAQMLANYGVGTVCIVIHTAGGDQLGTWNIPYMVEPLPGLGSAAAKEYFTAFSKAVEGLAYPDASLSAPGKAADAAAVGMALAEKAPAGYGLGTTSPKVIVGIDGLNNATANGWYYVTDYNDSINNFYFGYALLHVIGKDNYHTKQILYPAATEFVLCRTMSANVWGEWEFENPPLRVGVEYRTTGRWNEKAVYTYLMNCGGLPNKTTVNVPLPALVTASSAIIGWNGWISYWGVSLPAINSGYDIAVSRGVNSIQITTDSDRTEGGEVYIALKYIKD